MRRRAGGHETGTLEPWGARPEKLRRARLFREAPTSAEAILWQGLRRRFVGGLRFRRQHVIAGYIVDFYCPSLRLAIEVDGGVHEARRERDSRRTAHLARIGTTILRVENSRVHADLAGILAHLAEISERLRARTENDR